MPGLQSSIRSRLPPRALHRLAPLTVPWHAATSWLRVAPSFLIIGAGKSGTTSLFEYVFAHPATSRPTHKEINYFTHQWERLSAHWYRGQFPTAFRRMYISCRHGARLVTGEASTSYLFRPDVPLRVRRTIPDVRLIATLRNPVDRAISDYHYSLAMGAERATLQEALEKEAERLARSPELLENPSYERLPLGTRRYLAAGVYDKQFERWLDYFPREQLLVIESEHLFADPHSTMRKVYGHLRLSPFELPRLAVHGQGAYPEADVKVTAYLHDFFAEPNRRLVELLRQDFSWAQVRPDHARRSMSAARGGASEPGDDESAHSEPSPT